MISLEEKVQIKERVQKTIRIILLIIRFTPSFLIAYTSYTFVIGCMMTSFLSLPIINILAPTISIPVTILAIYGAYLKILEEGKKKINLKK